MKVSTFHAILLATTLVVLSGGFSAFAQVQAPPDQAAQAPAPPPPPQAPTPQVITAPGPAAQAPAPRQAVPDYPEPRTLMIGVFYFLTSPSKGPDIIGGAQAIAYENVSDLGKGTGGFGGEASYPVTRTGTVYAEYWTAGGDGNQTISIQTNPFAQTYLADTQIATTYKVDHGRAYLDDLLFPHLFPVPRFRLKSIWGVQYTKVSATVDTPGVQEQTLPNGTNYGGPIGGGHTIIWPEFGIAAEYAIAPHLLLRADAAGFGFPHHSDIWEANVTLAYRVNHTEIVIGGKALHFKTGPNSSEFLVGTLDGAFGELRWHF